MLTEFMTNLNFVKTVFLKKYKNSRWAILLAALL